MPRFAFTLCVLAGTSWVTAAPPDGSTVARDAAPLYPDFFNRDFPFFEATLDLRTEAGAGSIIPRAVVLPLESGFFVAFDTELLRVAAVWRGNYPSLAGLAMQSYAHPLQKTHGGFDDASRPQGELIHRAEHLSDWQFTHDAELADPRTAWTDPREPGRGPLPFPGWNWIGVDDLGNHAALHYQVEYTSIREDFRVVETANGRAVRRYTTVNAGAATLHLAAPADADAMTFPPRRQNRTVITDYPETGPVRLLAATDHPAPVEPPKKPHWPDTMTTTFTPGVPQDGFAVDQLTLPYPNVWQRRIRLVDIAIGAEGIAHGLTYDGDVYELAGLTGPGPVTWRRVAAGFNEPMAITWQGAGLFVLSRGGITELMDRSGDGEFDRYQLFSHRFVQSPDTRDFAFSLIALSEGGFLISKGGQQIATQNPHSGRVLRISPDGQTVTVHASGLRNAFLARDPRTGVVTATDQQGNWVPATPFYVIEPGNFFGYAPSPPATPEAITPPHLWFPHAVSPSAVGMVLGFDDRMPPLQGKCLILDYKTSRGFVADLTHPDAGQTSAVALDLPFELPLLNGAIHPDDGQVYLVGFQIWDSHAPRLEGLCRLRWVGAAEARIPTAAPFRQGILLQNVSLASDSRFEVRAWNYRRSAAYGSPHFKHDGEPGVDALPVLATSNTPESATVFLHLPKWHPSMTVVVSHHWGEQQQEVFLSAWELPEFDPADHGFTPDDWHQAVDTIAGIPPAKAGSTEVSLDRGQQLVTQFGCTGCHAVSADESGKSGPSWVGLAGSRRWLADGTSTVADRDYLVEAILYPSAKIPAGYDDPDAGMPPYLGVLDDAALASVIRYLESLR